MKLTSDQVKHVAKLANLPLSDEEEKKYSGQLSKILDYIDQLNKCPTPDVEPTYNVSGLSNMMAKDEVSESLSQEDAIKNGKYKEGFFVTKGVFKE